MKPRVLIVAGVFLFASALPLVAGSVSGRILDSAGKPVAGARVAAHAFRTLDEALLDSTAGEKPPKAAEGSSGPDGRFRVVLERETPPVSLRVEAAGHPGVWIAGPFDAAEDTRLPDVLLSDPAKVSGRVADPEGKPVASALVTVSAVNGDFTDQAIDSVELRTGADGSFSTVDGVPAPRQIAVRAAGFPPLGKYSQAIVEERLVLARGGVIRGTVLDPAGRPAAGAVVRAASVAVRTGEDGTFRLGGVPRGLQWVEAVWKDDFVARKEGLRVSPGADVEAPLRLVRAASIVGSVTEDGTRKPIAGATVWAGETESVSSRGVRSARTDARGKYRLTGLAARAYDVWATRTGFLGARIAAVAAEPASPGTANIALPRGAVVSGKVVDEKGAPLAGARVRIEGGLSMRRGSRARNGAVTMADGTYRIHELPSGRNFLVEAQKPGYAPGRRAGLSLKTGETLAGMTIVLKGGLEAKGRVVDSAGNGIPGVEVRLTRRESNNQGFAFVGGRPPRPDATSTADGTFVVRGLEEAEYSAVVTRDGFAPKSIQSLAVRSGVENVWAPVTLQAGVSLAGVVKTTAGAPVVGAHVQWWIPNPGGGFNQDRSATSDVDGRFRLDGLAPGAAVQISTSAEGFASSSKTATPPSDDLVVILRTAGTIRGRVEDADAKRPVPGFSVASGTSQVGGGQSFFMRDWSAAGSPAQSEDGTFEIPNVTPGKITVRVTAPGYRPGEVAVEVAEGEMKEGVVVSLRRGGSISGRVVDGGRGTPIANASVIWQPSGARTTMGDFSSNSTTTDADGKFRFDGLPPGTVTVTARHPDYAEARKEVDPEKDAAFDVSLGAGGFISGVLVGRDGRSPVAAGVVAISGTGTGNDTARTDDAGAFSFDHLRPGRYRLTARTAQGQPPPRDVVLTENERQEGILLAIRGSGARIRGTVTGLPADKLGTIRVFAASKEWNDSALADDTGAFSFLDVPAGSVRLIATAQTGMSRSTSKTVEIPEGASEVPVEVAFEGNSRLTGRITRADRPLANAYVSAVPDPPSSASRSQGQSDENGRYTVDGLTDGPHVVAVNGQGFSYRKTITVSGETVADIAVPSSGVAGVVTDEASGEALEGAHIQAETGRESSSFAMKSAMTDATGHYEISGVDAGTYQVTARKAGYQMRTRSVTVGSDSTEASFALVKGAGVVLRVTDGTTGLPMGSVYATAFASTGLVAFEGEVSLDGSGKGEIPSLAGGRYSVYLFAGRFAPRSIPSLQVPTGEVAVSMTPGGRVELRCDAPISGRLTDASGNVYMLGNGRIDGRFFAGPPLLVWENVAPGSYTLTLASGKTYALTVSEGQTSRLDLK